MNDPELRRLVTALDNAADWAVLQEGPIHPADLEIARLRLQCLSRRLGNSVSESPYLSFIQRLCAATSDSGQQAAAAGA